MDFWKSIDEASAPTMEKKEFEKLPEGVYSALVSDVTIKEDLFETSVNVEFTINDGPFKSRKSWYSTKITQAEVEAKHDKLTWLKSTICQLAGVKSTDGNPLQVLADTKGNLVKIKIKHNPSKKGDGKVYVNTSVLGRTDVEFPF